MTTASHHARSFGAVADVYEAGRPGYPGAAVAWMVTPVDHGPRLRIADIGAGTGKLTRSLVDIGADVVAVDPDAAMLATLAAHVPGVPTLLGTAERLPLPDASRDAVVLGQAWHWVDPIAGSAEVGRVLRPGGVLGLVWNIRDESVPWVRRLTAIMRGSNAEALLARGGPRVRRPLRPAGIGDVVVDAPGLTRDAHLDGALAQPRDHRLRRRARSHRPRVRGRVRRDRRAR